jgi:hypothetical protein
VSHEGSLDIDGEKVSVAVLEDGTEGFLRESLAQLIGMSETDHKVGRFASLGAKFGGKHAESFKEKDGPVLRLSGQRGYFVSADAATALITGMARAFIDGKMHAQQRHIHERCLHVQCALVSVGLKSVIRDAVGYTQVRSAPLFERLLRETPAPWSIVFGPDLVQEFCRVWRKDYVVGRQPRWLAQVYYKMYQAFTGEPVLVEIRARKSKRSQKHHQLLNDTAHDLLVSQLGKVKILLKVADNEAHFWALFNHQFQGLPLQTAMFWPN